MLARAHGVVVSRLLRMQKALGSNPSGSMFLREFFCEAVVQSVARNMAICRYGNMRPPGIEPGGTIMGSFYVTTTLQARRFVGCVFFLSGQICRRALGKIQHPRIELGTFRVLGGRHNH